MPAKSQARSDLQLPGVESRDTMWEMMEKLFPRYRALCGPDFAASLKILKEYLDLEILEFPTGLAIGEWTVPPEFMVNEAWVEDENGKRHLNFEDHPYHLWIYSRPFEGVVTRDELVKKVSVDPALPTAVPLRQTYYMDDWGFCATQKQVDALPPGKYRVHIDTKLKNGHLRVGEYYLPGESKKEILIDSYLCHPRGANDNLSGVVVVTELFRQLKRLKSRRLSYRLAIWPESIGPITWINTQPEKLKNVIGGYEISICGIDAPLRFQKSRAGDGITDRAALHVARHLGREVTIESYLHFRNGSDQGHFNMPGIRIPYGRISRSGAGKEGYKEYHSSADDLTLVRPDFLLDTLQFSYQVMCVLDRAQVWKPTYVGTPFLSKRGVYPYHHGIGRGEDNKSIIAETFYELMCAVDGESDLLQIADNCGIFIGLFDEAVQRFAEVDLVRPVS
jgi:aminopeptidase-like protein